MVVTQRENIVSRSILWPRGPPARVVGAHGDEHVQDERSQIRLVHHRLSGGQEAPF